MSELTVIDKAKTAAKQLLSILCIKRVVCVDDLYAHSQLEDVLGALDGCSNEDILRAIPEYGAAVPMDPEVRNSLFRRIWSGLDLAARDQRAALILGNEPGEVVASQDSKSDSILRELLTSTDVEFRALSPNEWTQQETEILKGSSETKTLLFFDQDLSGGGGAATGGMTIISSLLNKKGTEALVCGLLTHTVTVEDQDSRWTELAAEYSLSKDRFLVIAKRWLNEDPVYFVQILKLLALCPDFLALKTKARGILDSATAVAAEKVEAISVFDFDHIVFRTSRVEGIWEPETLFRLFALFHKSEARRMAHETGELEMISKNIRRVSQISTGTDPKPTGRTKQIQRQELYEIPEHINGLSLPLECGDIFQKIDSTSSKSYILLAPPCDLMVRSDGKRAPEIDKVPLFEIVKVDADGPLACELPYFVEDGDARYQVKLKRAHHISPHILDLCVFNGGGESQMSEDSVCPEGVSPSWQERHKYLKACFGQLQEKCGLACSGSTSNTTDSNGDKFTLVDMACPFKLVGGPFKGTLSVDGTWIVSFKLKRVSRLSRDRATAFLREYANCLGRPAFDPEFSENVSDESTAELRS